MRKVCLIAVLLLGLAVTALPSLAQNPTVVGGDEASLRKMLERVILRYGYVGPNDHAVALVGQLPVDMPFSLPLPPDATLIGSVTMEFDYGSDEIYFETNLTADELFAFYETALDDGFVQPEALQNYAPAGGFGSADFPPTVIYCYNGAEAALTLLLNTDTETTQVTALVMQPALMDVCHGITPAEMGMSTGFSRLPSLSTPPGAELRILAGGSGSNTSATSEGLLISPALTAADLLAYYTQEIQGQGWTIASSLSDASGSWLTFTLTDENGMLWGGYLTLILDPATPAQYNAHVGVYQVIR